MGQQDYPFDLGKEDALRLPAKLLVAASGHYLDPLLGAMTSTERGDIFSCEIAPAEDVPVELLSQASCIVVEVDPSNDSSLARLERIRQMAPGLPQIVALADANVALVRTLIRQGVNDVVSLPFDIEELLQASVAAAEEYSKNEAVPLQQAPLVAITKSVGGVGASTIAANLADELGRHSPNGRGACLVDLDVQIGSLGPMLGLTPRRNINDLLTSGSRLDGAYLRSVAATHSDHLSLIAAPTDIEPLESVDTDRILRVIDKARAEFDVVVLDLPGNWTSWNLSLILEATVVVMVVALDVPSIRQAKRQIELFRTTGIDTKKIVVVPNRVEKRLFRMIGLDDVSRTLKQSVIGTVHLDEQVLTAAKNQGLLASQVQKRSPFNKDIVALARILEERFAQSNEP